MKSLRLLALRRLRRQPLRATIAAVSVAAGVSLAVTLVVVSASISQSVEEHGRALAGPTPLRVIGATSRGSLDTAELDAVRHTDGVAAAVPLVQAVTMVDTGVGAPAPALALGIDCSIEALVGPFGCSEQALDTAAATGAPPVVSPSLAGRLHENATLRTDVGRIPLAGAAAAPGLDRLSTGDVIVFPMARAQQLFARPGTVDVIYVQPAAGVDPSALRERLQAAVGPTSGVLGAGDPPPLVGVLLTSFLPLFTLLTVLGLGVGAVLVYNTVTLSVEERRRQLAIVGALGGTSRVLVGGTLLEAGVLGLAGGILGALGGIAIAGPITSSFSQFTERVAGISLDVHVTAATFVVGAALGLLLSLAAAWRPARRARRLDVAAELSNRDLRDETSTRSTVRRALVWAAIALLGIDGCAIAAHDGGLEAWQASFAPIAFAVAVGACTMLVAAMAPLVITALVARLSGRSAPRRLAVASLSSHPGRTGVMAVALGMAVGVAFLTASYTVATRQTITDNLTKHLHGVSVSTLEPNNTGNIDAKLSNEEIDRLAHLPGVARVERSEFVVVGHDTNELVGVSGFDDPWLDAYVLSGVQDRTRFDSGEVIVGPKLARQRGVRAGGTIELDTPSGAVRLPVLAVVQDGDFGGSNIQMPLAMLERLYGPQPAQNVNVVAAPGVSDRQLADGVKAAAIDPQLRVKTANELASDIADSIDQQLSSFWVLQRGLLVTAFVAVLSTLLLVGVQRRRELALLAAVGMRPGELARMVLTEAGLIGIVGAGLGLLISLPMYGALLLVGPIVIGYREPFVLDPSAAVTFAVVAVVVALAGAAWPAWRTSRIEVLAGLQYD